MRPLFHPSIEDVTVEGILHALSDPARVAIFAQIVGSGVRRIARILQRSAKRPYLNQRFPSTLRRCGRPA